MKTLFTIIFTAIMLASCGEKEQRSILPEGCELHAGDVVFRRGSGLTSHAVLAADRYGAYSHIGIVVDSCGVMMVVHAVPGEPDYEGDPDRVKMDTPKRFFLVDERKDWRGETIMRRLGHGGACGAFRHGSVP